jgi:hypothetical protein
MKGSKVSKERET